MQYYKYLLEDEPKHTHTHTPVLVKYICILTPAGFYIPVSCLYNLKYTQFLVSFAVHPL